LASSGSGGFINRVDCDPYLRDADLSRLDQEVEEMKSELIRQLRADEGERSCVYNDHLGFATIGVGRLVDARKPGAGLRSDEIAYLLNNDIDDRIDALTRKLPWFQNLDDARKGVLLNMAFQMGVDGLLKFKNTLRLVMEGKYALAAEGMLQSLWAKQTPSRAKRLAEQMRTGQWVWQ
jgi:lysozyme